MPRGPKGEKRPADVVSNAVLVGRIATGDTTEDRGVMPSRAKGGKAGGRARATSLSPDRRAEIARRAAAKRWESGSDS